MRENPEGGELDPPDDADNAPTSRRLIVVMQSPILFQVVGQNGETTFPRGPIIR